MEQAAKKRKGRPPLSNSEKKRRKTCRNEIYLKTRIYLGSESDRWKRLKEEKQLKSDREVATLLIDL